MNNSCIINFKVCFNKNTNVAQLQTMASNKETDDSREGLAEERKTDKRLTRFVKAQALINIRPNGFNMCNTCHSGSNKTSNSR